MPKFDRTLTAEIFAPGTWNGMSFNLDDLKGVVESFKALKDIHRVPLKLGHNDEQPMTDGEPALGWVDDVFIDKGKDGKTKLMAKFTNLPEVVFNAIKKKLYRNVSIELDFDVKHNRGRFDYVLSGVALLGADIPAVNILADLTAYMQRGSMVAARRACFTAISTKEGTDVSDELKAQLAEIRGQLSELQTENATLKAEKTAFAAKEKAREEAEAKQAVADTRAKFTKLLDDAVKDEKILPAQRETFSKILKLDDDGAVMAVTEDAVQALIDSVGGVAGKRFSKDHAKNDTREKRSSDPGVDLTEKARAIQNQTPGLTFSKALERAMAADSELAKAHITESASVEED